MKRVVIRIAGSESDPIDRDILPGQTAGEVLAELNLEGYVLSLLPNPDQFLSFFEDEEDLYSQLREGDRLCAVACSEAADAFINQIAFGSF